MEIATAQRPTVLSFPSSFRVSASKSFPKFQPNDEDFLGLSVTPSLSLSLARDSLLRLLFLITAPLACTLREVLTSQSSSAHLNQSASPPTDSLTH